MTERPSPYVIEEIKRALATDPRVGELGVTVEIVHHEVYLRGSVATADRRDAISSVATACCPDLTVHNEVQVEELHAPAAVENLS